MSGIEKKGEGVGRSESQIPLEIQYSKLVEWLVERKQVGVEWRKQHSLILKKIHTAKTTDTDPPPLLLKYFQDHANVEFGYLDCEKVIELLKLSNESEAKNFFGQYQSKRFKDWYEILNLYKKDNVFIVEEADTLATLVNFDLPNLKKQCDAIQKQLEEFKRKESDSLRNASQYTVKFSQSCSNLGIKGENIRQEILKLVDELPNYYAKISAATHNNTTLKDAAHFYQKYLEFTLSYPNKNVKPESLKVLNHILTHGNSTVSFYETGAQSNSTEIKDGQKKDVQTDDKKDSDVGGLEIDWTVIEQPSNDSTTPLEIDWDISIESSSNATTEISWDVGQIEVIDSAITEQVPFSIVEEKKAPVDPTLLDSNNTRTLFMDDLVELRDFLTQRKSELNSKNDFSFITVDLPTELTPGEDVITAWIAAVNTIVQLLEDTRFRALLEIKNSNRYVDRLVAAQNHLLECADKFKNSAIFCKGKQEELKEQLSTVFPKQEKTIATIKQLQQHLIQSISALYNNRIIYLYVPV